LKIGIGSYSGIAACVAACVALGACETAAQRVSDKEDLLAAAGFTVRPANTPQRLASLRKLPANRFVPKAEAGAVEYVYADPIVCNCLYVGNQAAFDAYKNEVFTRDIVNQQQLTAEIYSDPWSWDGWNWGPWGGPGYWR
jgi:hypothetical protein